MVRHSVTEGENFDMNFKQIIELKNKVFAIYKNEDDSEHRERCRFAALDEKGVLIFLDYDQDEGFASAEEISNFIRFEFDEI